MSTTQIAAPPHAAEPADGRHDVVELDVTGMSCGSCVARVQGALAAAPGVADAAVNFATGRATVEVQPGSDDAQALVEVVERIGYGATPVDRHPLGRPTPSPRSRRTRPRIVPVGCGGCSSRSRWPPPSSR